jgi:transposase
MEAERVVATRRRHSEQLKALVLEQCAAPGASVAKVAMSHGLNANLVHGWRKRARQSDGAAVLPPRPAGAPVKTTTSVPQFVAVSVAQAPPPPPVSVDIRVELRRGTTAMQITWPISAAADCAAWMRELLR